MKLLRVSGLLLCYCFLASCNKPAEPPPTPTLTPGNLGGKPAAPPAGEKLRIGYVLHGLNDFTQVIKRGAEDAGKALGVDVEVIGPADFKAEEAINQFEGMVQKKVDGLACMPMPG